jgi:hypothetical protein
MRASRSASPGRFARCRRLSSANVGRRVEVQDARFLRAKDRSLIERRQEPAGPVVRRIDRRAAGIGEDHVRGQALRFGAEAVDEPAPHRRATGDAGDAAVEVADRDFVAVVPGVHGAEQADIVHDAGGVREEFRDFGAALAVLLELPRAAEQFLARAVDEAEVDVPLVILAVVPGEFRLRVEEIDVARPAVHEQRDHRLGLRREVRRAGLEAGRQILTWLARPVGRHQAFAL